MLVRCTARALNFVGRAEFVADAPGDSNEWYLNLLWLERRKCLLLVHATTLYSTFVKDVRKADVHPFGQWAVAAVADALDEEGLTPELLGTLAPELVATAKTASRRVLGFMNDMALHIEYAMHDDGGLRSLDVDSVNRGLRRTLHQVDGYYVTPMEAVAAYGAKST